MADLSGNMNEVAKSVMSFVDSRRLHFDEAIEAAVIVDTVSKLFKASLVRMHFCLMLLHTQWYFEKRGRSLRFAFLSRVRARPSYRGHSHVRRPGCSSKMC
jgi:hypothetical protein